jgi:hypothetical protein
VVIHVQRALVAEPLPRSPSAPIKKKTLHRTMWPRSVCMSAHSLK